MLNLNYMADKRDLRVVVIGGGTGSFMILSGLKKYVRQITALVSMADGGGSTGVLRDELGVLPPGDVRQCLVALSDSPKLRELFNYRFSDGNLRGHSFGNLFLTALEKMTGNFSEAVDVASEVLDINGHQVVPVILDKVTLIAEETGREIRHEREIRNTTFGQLRPTLRLEPVPEPNPRALAAIAQADLIVIAPGGLYESLGATLAVPGIGAALKNARGRKIYVCNLMNQAKHTPDFAVTDYVDELERMAGYEFIDEVIYNTHLPNEKLIKKYALEGEAPVRLPDTDVQRHYRLLGADLLARSVWTQAADGDVLASQRALIRHDSDRLAQSILGGYDRHDENVQEVETLYVIDMDRTLIRTSLLFDCLCDAANHFQDHLGDELKVDYAQYLAARDCDFAQLDFASDNEYIKMRLTGQPATFSPTVALDRILTKRRSAATAQDVYAAMAEQLAIDDKYAKYLLPGVEELLRYIQARESAAAVILTYGEQAFQQAKFSAVVAPLLQKIGLQVPCLATPDRRKAGFFWEHVLPTGEFEIKGMYGLNDVHAREAVQIGDERADIIGLDELQNYRGYCVKSPLDHSRRAAPSAAELAANYCQLFESLQEVVDAERKLV